MNTWASHSATCIERFRKGEDCEAAVARQHPALEVVSTLSTPTLRRPRPRCDRPAGARCPSHARSRSAWPRWSSAPATGRGRCVHLLLQHLEIGASLLDLVRYVSQIADRAAKAIKTRHHQRVSIPQEVQHLAQLLALVAFRAGDLL